MIKLVLTDLDDTLITRGSGAVTKRSHAAIHALLDEGIRFGPVTGRTLADMTWMFDSDEACYATGAFVNGQIVQVDGEIVRGVALDRALLEAVARVLDATWGEGYLALYNPWVLEDVAYVTTHAGRLRTSPPVTYGSITKVITKVTDFSTNGEGPEQPACIKANVQCCCAPEYIPALRDHLSSEIPELNFVLPGTNVPVIDILPSGWDKGASVCVLAEALGVTPREIAAFGDSDNDLPMMRSVSNFVAVGNATKQVALKATWHIGSCAQGAVADAFDDIAASCRQGRLPNFMGGGHSE